MPKAKITFKGIDINVQVMGGSDELLYSRVLADMRFDDGRTISNVQFIVGQPKGDRFEDGPLDVKPAPTYSGPPNYAGFQQAVERYYRAHIGPDGQSFGGINAMMIGCTVRSPMVIEIDLPDEKDSGGGW